MKDYWIFYIVRYFVGTVVGSVIVAMLLYHSGSTIANMFSLSISNVQELKQHHFIVAAVLGLAFCYISSAPILVMHTVRCYLPHHLESRSIISRIIRVLVLLVSPVVLSLIMLKDTNYKPYVFICMMLVSMIILYQILLVGYGIKDKLKVFIQFYQDLSKARSKENKTIQDYRESYRHLREHGNAFLILIFEAVLGITLFVVPQGWMVISILVLWLLPSMVVWFYATSLEANLPA